MTGNKNRNAGEQQQIQQQGHDDEDNGNNTKGTSGKQLSNSAINIKRREDYANMDPASKDRERTRVKRSRAVKMARDSLPGTAWAELDRHSQAEVAGAISEEIRSKYAAATPGPSSRTAAEYAVQKIFADKSHLFLPNDGLDQNDYSTDDVETKDGWVASELTRGWKNIIQD